jgi:hypothetical protein
LVAFDTEISTGVDTDEVTFDLDTTQVVPLDGDGKPCGVVLGYTTQENPE